MIIHADKGRAGIRNVGDGNVGTRNAGDENFGDGNVGTRNAGDGNTGNWNAGNGNVGHRNAGKRNAGNGNVGNWNTGDGNVGNWNVGSLNVGDWNTGDWNTGNWNTGFFNTDEPFARSFNKPTNMSIDEFRYLPGVRVLYRGYENNCWIWSSKMTDEEKAAHPGHEVIGGYLKPIPFKEACVTMWKGLADHEKDAVRAIPNFDAKIFEEITGIDSEAR